MKKLIALIIIIIAVIAIVYFLNSGKNANENADNEQSAASQGSYGIVTVQDGDFYADALKDLDVTKCGRIINLPLKEQCIQQVENIGPKN